MMLLAAFNLINHMAEKTLGCSPISKNTNRISGVMVSVLNSSAVDRGFESDQVQPQTIKMVFVASPLSTQHKEKEQRLVG